MFICMNLGLRQTCPLHLCLGRVDFDQRQLACSARNGSEILLALDTAVPPTPYT